MRCFSPLNRLSPWESDPVPFQREMTARSDAGLGHTPNRSPILNKLGRVEQPGGEVQLHGGLHHSKGWSRVEHQQWWDVASIWPTSRSPRSEPCTTQLWRRVTALCTVTPAWCAACPPSTALSRALPEVGYWPGKMGFIVDNVQALLIIITINFYYLDSIF